MMSSCKKYCADESFLAASKLRIAPEKASVWGAIVDASTAEVLIINCRLSILGPLRFSTLTVVVGCTSWLLNTLLI
jgi:hypothetical protein